MNESLQKKTRMTVPFGYVSVGRTDGHIDPFVFKCVLDEIMGFKENYKKGSQPLGLIYINSFRSSPSPYEYDEEGDDCIAVHFKNIPDRRVLVSHRAQGNHAIFLFSLQQSGGGPFGRSGGHSLKMKQRVGWMTTSSFQFNFHGEPSDFGNIKTCLHQSLCEFQRVLTNRLDPSGFRPPI